MKKSRLSKRNVWTSVTVCLLTLLVSGIAAKAALEGRKSTVPPPWLSLFGVAIEPSSGGLFVVGAKGLVMTSADKGQTWKQIPVKLREGGELFQDYDLYSIRFSPSGKTALIVGENGTALRSDDGGASWKKAATGTTKNLMKVYVVDDQNAAAVGADGIILRTTDGGNTWQSVKSPKMLTLFDVTFLDKNQGWIAGEFSTVMATTDGGQTWNVIFGGNTMDFTIGPYFTISFTDATHGMVAGLAGDVEVTEDGGKSWKPSKLPDQTGTYAVATDTANKKTWAAGTGGRTFVQAAGGPWVEAQRATFNDLTDIALAGNRAVMVGLNGTILLSNDAGEKWQAVQ